MNSRSAPNVVFILVDDMGYGDFSVFNDGRSSTPTLDALMAEGTGLTQQYSASPVCNPSRASLLTGRYPHRTGSIDTLEWWGLDRLALRETSLAEVLSRAGYATSHIGKWHLGAYDDRYHPRNRGYGEAVCFRGGMHDYWDWRLDYQDTVLRADGRYLTDVWTDEAVSFVERRAGEGPFFLSLNYNAPHTPLQAPEEEIAPFLEDGRFNEGVATLYGMIRRMDSGVAKVLDALDRTGQRDNTVVVFTSDNGPQFGTVSPDHCAWDITRFNCQYAGAKGTTYEGGIRVPGIIRWPAGLEGGRTVDQMVHFTDWFPTLLSAIGIDTPGELNLDGRDAWPVLQGLSDQVEQKRFWQWNRFAPDITANAAMRDGDWKLVRPRIDEVMRIPDNDDLRTSMYEPERFIEGGLISGPYPDRDVPPPPPAELYDLASDPLERHDLAGEQTERTRRMLSDLETWFEDVEADRATIDDGWQGIRG